LLVEDGTTAPAAAADDGVSGDVVAAAAAGVAEANGNHAEMVMQQPGQAVCLEAQEQTWQQVEQQEQQHFEQQEIGQLDQGVEQMQACEVSLQGQVQQQQHQAPESVAEQQAVQQVAALQLQQPDAEQQQGYTLLHQQHKQDPKGQEQQQQQQQQQHSETMGNGTASKPMSGAELQQQLAAREAQLSRAAARLSELESNVAQLSEAKAGGWGAYCGVPEPQAWDTHYDREASIKAESSSHRAGLQTLGTSVALVPATTTLLLLLLLLLLMIFVLLLLLPPELEVVVQQLSEANEQLHLRAAKVSEAELQEVQQEAADRLAAAERKVRGSGG
jgi:hypothetical protein